jgi:hypothetical protein
MASDEVRSENVETLGSQATKIAKQKADEWIGDAMTVVTKSVSNMARQGMLF